MEVYLLLPAHYDVMEKGDNPLPLDNTCLLVHCKVRCHAYIYMILPVASYYTLSLNVLTLIHLIRFATFRRY